MCALKNLIGQHFDRLEVIERAESRKRANGRTDTQWLCRCDCGAEVIVLGLNLVRKNTRSCGCLRKEASAQRMKALLEKKQRKKNRIDQ